MPLFTSLRAIVAPRSGRGAVKVRAPAEPPRLSAGDVERVRFGGEAEAAARLRRIKGFREEARQQASEHRLRTQRQVSLSRSTRLEPAQAPGLFRALEQVSAMLGVSETVEVYQDAGAVNASMCAAEGGPLLTLEGPLLELLSFDELRGLLGHELAHYRCHTGPLSPHRDEARVAAAWRDSRGASDADAARRRAANALSVAQEITADRFELLATRDLGAFLTTALKLGTELPDAVLRHDPEVLLRQAREALWASCGQVDGASSHPERHVRVRAAELFFRSDLYRTLTGERAGERSGERSGERAGERSGEAAGEVPIAEADAEVARLLAGWTPAGSAGLPREQLERFLLAAASAIVAADGTFSKAERAFLARTLPSAFSGKILPRAEADALLDQLASAVAARNDEPARVTTLNFLCGLVDADGKTRDEELVAIDVVGRALGARELFRHELRCRYDFEPSSFVPGQHDDADDAVREATASLLRYLDTVVVAGERRTSLSRLLKLGGYGRRTRASIARLAAVLDASGVLAEPPLRSAKDDGPLVLRAELRSPPSSGR